MELYKKKKKDTGLWLGDKEEMWVTVKVIKLRKQKSLQTALTHTHTSENPHYCKCAEGGTAFHAAGKLSSAGKVCAAQAALTQVIASVGASGALGPRFTEGILGPVSGSAG